MTRRRIRKVHEQARRWYRNGQHWEQGHTVNAPSAGAMRIAFDAGREAERRRKAGKPLDDDYNGLPIKVWTRVFAEWTREW